MYERDRERYWLTPLPSLVAGTEEATRRRKASQEGERRESRACEASQHRQIADRSSGTQQALIHAQLCPRREPAGQRGRGEAGARSWEEERK